MPSERALGILFDTYWTSAGWRKEPGTSTADFEFARDAGYMFDPKTLGHDDIVRWLAESVRNADRNRIRDAFTASLSTRRLDWRSALGSYGFARHFPGHSFKVDPRYSFASHLCVLCGLPEEPRKLDLNVLNFERHRWGGVRHDSPIYAAFDLEQFVRLEPPKPQQDDSLILDRILKTAVAVPPNARAGDLETALVGVFPSNRWERRTLIQILGFCGILQPSAHPGYFRAFPSFAEREADFPSVGKIDWRYPICWWRGRDGVDQLAISFYLGVR